MIPRRANGLRAAVVVLKPGAVMDWHSTGSREELLIALAGRVQVHTAKAQQESQQRKGKTFAPFAKFCDFAVVRVGQCAFLPHGTQHCVVNRSASKARYLYVTA